MFKEWFTRSKGVDATRIGIILGSTRPGRNGEAVARRVHEIAAQRTDAEFELVDLLDCKLPLLDEAYPPSMGQYTQPHTLAWANKIASFDGFVIVTAEYNHSVPGALKNAVDFLYAEWNNKAVGFVSYYRDQLGRSGPRLPAPRDARCRFEWPCRGDSR